jgi:hypothetical protein
LNIVKKTIHLILILSILLTSCDSKNKSEETIVSKNRTINAIDIPEKELSKIKTEYQLSSELKPSPKYSCDRIIITSFKQKEYSATSTIDYRPFDTECIIDVNNDEFNLLIKKAKKTGYCCCPERNYQILFFDHMNNFETYLVDTTTDKKQVRIFESSYQFSYLVNERDWELFLTNQKKINYSKYFITEFSKAKEAYNYALKNELPIVTSNCTSRKWMDYEGDFTIVVSAVGKTLDEQGIYKNIYKQYPTDDYKIETRGRYQMCGSYNGNDCYEEYVLKLFCNKSFHDKFKAYLPKSYFDKAIAAFIVLGSKEELDKMDKMYQKNK